MNACDDRIRRSTERYYREILGLPDWSARTHQRLTRDFERTMFHRLESLTGPVAGKAVLDVGCGWGGIVPQAAAAGARAAVGVEPDLDRLGIAAEMLARSGRGNAIAIQAIGESLPLAANSFEVVASYQVLEHVRDPAAVLLEIHRVLKPGGALHFNTPNYLAFREPHYKVLWFPLLPKRLARLYLRMRGRDAHFIDHIHYVNPLTVRAMLRRAGFVVSDIHEQRVRGKVDAWLRRVLPGAAGARCVLSALAALPIFLIYILFLNRDQEYVAHKR